MRVQTPTGGIGTPPAALAPPPPVLTGRSIGVLDNTKPNAGLLLDRLVERLAERTGAVRGHRATKNAALPCEDQVLETMIAEVELVLTGSAD